MFGAGCGYHATIQTSLNATARAVNIAGENIVKSCDAREQAVVERLGHTFEEDSDAIEAIRIECNEYFHAIERVRVAHDAAISAYEAVKDYLPEDAQ
jgi:hypothetical protein